MNNKITIDLTKLAERMIKGGFTYEVLENDDLCGWSNLLLDSANEIFNLEGLLMEEIKKLSKPNNKT